MAVSRPDLQVGRLVAAALLVSAASLTAHDPVGTKVSWEREIAPIFQSRCVSCHSPGGRAPMALTTYDEVRPWARAIREEVLTRRMPRWHVVRGYGDVSNDRSLSPFEIALITAWVDGGAPASIKTTATTSSPADKPEPMKPLTAPSDPAPPRTRTVTIPCSATALPVGRVLALKPELPAGGSLRVDVTDASGIRQPLLWVRDADPAFAETYWLRRPLDARKGMRATIVADAPGLKAGPTGAPSRAVGRGCALSVLLAAQTAR